MRKNIVRKIIEAHLVSGEPAAGSPVGIKIDQTLTQDATGTMAYLQFEALGFDRVKTELSVSYVDHNTVQDGFENADDHKYLESVAAKYGALFSKPGNGICHQVHLERFGRPGKTLLGSDSHTPTGGGIGMLAIGAGGLDVAVAMGGGAFHLAYPSVIKVELAGALRPYVSAKDIILALLEILGTKGNAEYVLEYAGPAVAALSVPERATMANMGAELGVAASVFPADETTRRFLAAQGREGDFSELSADAGAAYDKIIEIDLSELGARAACPHSPGNVKKLSELSGVKVDQVLIGSCTNASYRDIMLAAALLKGRKAAPWVSLGVAAGSRQVLEMVSRNGALADIISAGARVLESACGFCIGNSAAPRTDAVSVRTSNRNFFGRSGTPSAQVYLASPEAAAAAAVCGEIRDPEEFFAGVAYPEIAAPDRFIIDDCMILKPADDPSGVEIYRGPNIGAPPSNDACPDEIAGLVAIKVGDKITTDHIMPAGGRLKYRSNIQKYAEFVFEREDPEFSKRALADKMRGAHNIVVAGESYGQGSSREHAAICPMYLGVKMVIAVSMERIHRANLINFGIIPALFEDAADYAKLGRGDELTISGVRKRIDNGDCLEAVRKGDGLSIRLRVELTARERRIILAGGLINECRDAGK